MCSEKEIFIVKRNFLTSDKLRSLSRIIFNTCTFNVFILNGIIDDEKGTKIYFRQLFGFLLTSKL